jgi:hypothetical protein
VRAALALLLTCDTVSEARDKTNERLAAAGAREWEDQLEAVSESRR